MAAVAAAVEHVAATKPVGIPRLSIVKNPLLTASSLADGDDVFTLPLESLTTTLLARFLTEPMNSTKLIASLPN